MDLFQKEKRFFSGQGSIYIKAKGMYEYVYPLKNFPKNNDFELSEDQERELIEIQKEIYKLEKEKQLLKHEFCKAINALGTYNRVESDFPEAFKLFPPMKPKSNLPAINLVPLRNKLK
mgnify:CR=1 FL=1